MIRLFSLITFGSSSATACSIDLPPFVGLLELGRHVVERLGDGHVERDVRVGDALARRHRAELELVAGERERARAVAVARVARQLRQHHDARVERAAVLGRLRAALFDLLEDVGQHVAEEDRENRRRRFVRAEAMIVARARDAGAQQALPLVDRAQHGGAEHEELHVVVRVRARATAGCGPRRRSSTS